MSKQNNFSRNTEINISFCFNSPDTIINKWETNKICSKPKKRVFEVFHKKEMICTSPDSVSIKDGKKKPIIKYRCIYCGNKYNNMNRFEAHMRIHVSQLIHFNKLFINFYRLVKNLINVLFAAKYLLKKEI